MGKHYTKRELDALKKKKVEKKAKERVKGQITVEAQVLSGNENPVLPPSDENKNLPSLRNTEQDPWSGLTERQTLIQRLRLRGMSQQAIGRVLSISQPMVHKELKNINKIHEKKGVSVKKELVVGKSLSIFEEVAYKAWEIYGSTEDDKAKLNALNTVMNATEKQVKLLTDLGLVERAAERVNHTHELKKAPLLEEWNTEGRAKLAENILTAQLNPLEEPEPPEDEDPSIEDAEILDPTED